jgi:hypothetical protein
VSDPNNPPAFPTPDCSAWDGDSRTQGMSLRDWFAGQALTGLLANRSMNLTYAAEVAYNMADAMLAARKGATT